MKICKRTFWRCLLTAAILCSMAMAIVLHTGASTSNTPLALNDTFVTGTITSGGSNGDIHFYSATVPASGFLTITYQGFSIGQSYCKILSSDMTTEYDSSYVATSTSTSPITKMFSMVVEPGTYIVKIYSSSTSRTGDYRVKASFQAAGNNETEPNDDFNTAMQLSSDKTVTGLLSVTDKNDFYRIAVPASQKVTFSVVSYIKGIYFWLYDGNCVQLDKKYISTGSASSPKSYTYDVELSPGTYYVKLTPYSTNYSKGYGTYTLSWAPTAGAVTSIEITGNKTVAPGSSFTLSTVVSPSNAVNQSVTWSSSNTSVATVTSTGKVTAKKTGYTTITAKAKDGSGVSKSVTVIVKPKKMSKPTVSSSKAKRLTVKWNKLTGVSGYQIRYSKKKSFSSYTTKKVSKSLSKKTYKVTSGKTYYVKIRAYYKYGSNTYYGTWSTVSKVKVK